MWDFFKRKEENGLGILIYGDLRLLILGLLLTFGLGISIWAAV